MNFIHNSLWLGCTYKFRITAEMFGITPSEFKQHCISLKSTHEPPVWLALGRLIKLHSGRHVRVFN